MTGPYHITVLLYSRQLVIAMASCKEVEMEALFDVETAAQKLGGVSPWTVRSWLTQGKLQRTRVGRRVMIRESDLERFLASQNGE